MNDIKDIIKYHPLNSFAFFIYERLEKITTAIYLVTGFLPKEEPLKFHLRNKSVQLMSYILSLKDNKMSLSEDSFSDINSLVLEIKSSLKISVAANIVSEMNYSILDSELGKILDLIQDKKNEGIGRKIFLSRDFFEKNNLFNEKAKEFSIGHLTKGQSKGQEVDKGQSNFETTKEKENIKDIAPRKNSLEEKKQTKQKGSNRKDLIIKIIKDKKEVTIKDIAKLIKNCSEKTIQRELVSLLNDNVLKKEGERRWSKYSLNY